MAEITLHKDNVDSNTMVPNRFIDEYMTSANGEFVKIFLYLLRCMNAPECSFSISKTADKFEHTEKDIQRALKYWEKMNLLRLEYDDGQKLCGIYFLGSDSPSPAPKAKEAPEPTPVRPGTSSGFGASPVSGADSADHVSGASSPQERPCYTADEMLAFREKEDIQELMFVAERYLGHVFNPTDIQTLLYWYDGLSFSADLIVYLMEYCIAKGHSSLRYMEKVALNWKDSGIRTVEQAKRSVNAHSQAHYTVMKALGIQGRSLVPAETAFIDKWTKDLGFSMDIITEACGRTIAATHQPSFEYTDKILVNWHKKQVRQLSDIAVLDASYQKAKQANRPAAAPSSAGKPNKFNDFPQRTYDYDKLEAQLLNAKH